MAVRTETVVNTETLAFILWQSLMKECHNDSRQLAGLLMSPNGVQVNGRSLLPVEVNRYLGIQMSDASMPSRKRQEIRVDTLPMGGVGGSVDWLLEPMFGNSDLNLGELQIWQPDAKVGTEDLAVGLEKIMIDAQSALNKLATTQTDGQPQIKQKIQVNRDLRQSVERVNQDQIARALKLHPSRFVIQGIKDGRPGQVKIGRVSVTPILAVAEDRVDFSVENVPFWAAAGFKSYQEWLIKDPLLIQIDTTGMNPMLMQSFERFNELMRVLVKQCVSVLSEATISDYMARALDGRSLDSDVVWSTVRSNFMSNAIRVLYESGLSVIQSFKSSLVDIEAVFLRNGASLFHPMELALAGQAANSFFLGMDASAGKVQMIGRGDKNLDMRRLINRFRADRERL